MSDAAQPVQAADQPPSAPANPDRWIEEHGDALFRFALLRVRKTEIAEDLVQETLVSAWRGLSQYAGRSSERSWLTGILKRKIVDYFRKAGREQNFTDLEFYAHEGSGRFDSENWWIHERGPKEWPETGHDALQRSEFWGALESCLQKLPPRVASVFLLREMEDQSTDAVCETLSISPANLWVMLHRARMALRQCLEDNYFSPALKCDEH